MFHTSRHVGDFGNMPEDAMGNINVDFTDYLAALSGDNNIVGHGLVVSIGICRQKYFSILGESQNLVFMVLVIIDSRNGLSPFGTKPFLEPMLTF